MTVFNKKYTGQDNPCQQWPNTPTSITADFSDIDISGIDSGTTLEWAKFSFFNNFYSTGTVTLRLPSVSYTLRNISSNLSPPPATLDHTQLNNLVLGDSGHTQFALLQGRSGGQLLSGGINASHFLTLKAHRFGLNNIIVKDLETTFEKNINIGTKQILDGVNNSIDFVGGDMTLLNTSLTNKISVASQNDIDILANNQIKLGVPNASSNIVITSTDTTLNQPLDMNSNNIENANVITASNNLTLNAGDNNGIIIENAPNDTIIFQKSTNHNNNNRSKKLKNKTQKSE